MAVKSNLIESNWSDSEWDQFSSWLKEMLKSHEGTITFTKKDGSVRVMKYTLNTKFLPPVIEEQTKKERKINNNNLRVYDTEINEWRSFVIKSVTKVEFDNKYPL